MSKSRFNLLFISVISMLFFSSSSYAVRYYNHGHSYSFKPYVCYLSRSKIVTYKYVEYQYHDCFKSRKACYHSDARHFGKYSSSRQVNKAYKRCKFSSPRFVD